MDKIKKFESELDKYISYYVALDRANQIKTSSNMSNILLLESLQKEMLDKLKEDFKYLGLAFPEQRANETIDNFCIRIFKIYTTDEVKQILIDIEKKHIDNDNGTINYSQIIQEERNIKKLNNSADEIISFTKTFEIVYNSFFDYEDKYQKEIVEAVEIAHTKDIIVDTDNKSKDELYREIIANLTNKKDAMNDAIKSSINIDELNNKVKSIELYRFL